MNAIAKRTIRRYWEKYPGTKAALQEWHNIASKASWANPNEVTESVPNAHYVVGGRFVFKIKGNQHRLIVKVLFSSNQVFVRFIGTHAEYGKIDASTI